ncbi:hypothetical protein TVAG_135250 [Trichomonas vaginalis G3]|uniref:ubiquitinyl hydrolase 1 n=1 Tax=Trichomonas vaginalis (strain ATCC PRA-98 / G3) TaxID=412133 RepID=A2FCA9_TRIV3|nr:ubiquitinyl hydrolase protein [Trichomonas vaginalis G3]EAX97472.1 hypothetical protein TVAG_135250 [Trichomonas vaginalis G3]KAI5496576.1 ubiquitinyl hydrolase protein [Trichomonas vaginalis G3]|eukprot:XP_001310402.1 hypothetical protein [Trichomonas vaginalis G3]
MQSGFRDQMLPLLPQLKGETPRSNLARNVSLFAADWYQSFVRWLDDESSPLPGEIKNSELQSKLQNKENLEEHIDFEVLDKNIAETVFNFFHGGPQILRPMLADPKTQIGTVIIYPIKLSFIFDKDSFVSTVHPSWALEDIKKTIGAKHKFDPSTATFLSDSTNVVIPDDTTAQKIIELFGPKIQISLPGSLKMNPTQHGKTSSIGSVGSIPATLRMSTIAEGSIFSAFLQCLCRIPAFKEAVNQITIPATPNETNDTPQIAFVRYFREICQNPTAQFPTESSPISNAFNTAIYMRTDEINTIRHFELPGLLSIVFREINCGVDLFKFKEQRTELCPKCKYFNQFEVELTSMMVEITTKLFRKTKIEDCIAQYFSLRKRAKTNRWECPQCKKKVLVREQNKSLSTPNILVIYIHRFVKGSSHDFNILPDEVIYGPTLNLEPFTGNKADKYKLIGSIAHVGRTFTQRYKGFILEEDGKKWTMYNDNRSRPATARSVYFEEPLAMVYVRK